MKRLSLALLCLALTTQSAAADVKTKTIEYQHGDVKLQGYFAWDDSIEGQRPGVLVVHEWWGLNDYARSRAKQLAQLGYVAFALDMYGKGKVTEHPKQAGKWAGMIRKNINQWQERSLLGLKQLQRHELVDRSRIAAIGYCFGGATVMQIAYSGADVRGVVSFHGSLPPATPEQQKKIKAKILVHHGASDGFIPEERIAAFKKALTEAKADWHFVTHGGAVHSFTNPGADKRGIDGLKYDPAADRRSWEHTQLFFDEIFGK